MKVSIIIPVYNVERFIEKCLLSALNQSWQDIEIILVNDCTPDSSMSIIDNIISSHERSHLIKIINHSKNKGLSAARNSGIYNASGDYLYFLDSDDYISPNCIKLLAEAAIKYNVNLVIGDFEVVGEKRVLPGLKIKNKRLDNNDAILTSFLKNEWYVMAWNKLINRTYLESNSLFFYEGIVHEDDLWSFQLATNLDSLYIISDKTYFYYINSTSITSTNIIRNLECRIKIIDIVYSLIISTERLVSNRTVFLIFEDLKAKYFDRILYFCNDNQFQNKAYYKFRNDNYISFSQSILSFRPPLKLITLNLHYILPPTAGFYYYKYFISLKYYSLLLRLRLKKIFSKK